jgi:hypothetical protein
MDPTGTDGGDTDQISSGLSPQNSAEGSEKGPLVDRRDYPPPKGKRMGQPESVLEAKGYRLEPTDQDNMFRSLRGTFCLWQRESQRSRRAAQSS